MNKNANLEGNSFDERTAEEQRKIAKMGGIASGEARRRKRDIKAALDLLLEKEFKGKDGELISGAEAIAMKQFEKALKGDTRAFETVRDTAGQKPVDKIMVAEVEQETIDEIEALVASYDERHGG